MGIEAIASRAARQLSGVGAPAEGGVGGGVARAVAEWRDGARRADLLDELLAHPLDPAARSALTDLAERPDRAIEFFPDKGWARTQLAQLAGARDERTARAVAEALLEGRRGITRDEAVSEMLRLTRIPAGEVTDDDFRRVVALTWLPPHSKPAVPAQSGSHPLMNAYAHSLHPARDADTARDFANLYVANRMPDSSALGLLDELAHHPQSNTRAQILRALARSEHVSSVAADDPWLAERLHTLAKTWTADTTRAVADAVLEGRGRITAADAAREMVAITAKPAAQVTIDDYRRVVTLSMLPPGVAPAIPRLRHRHLLPALEQQRLPGRDIFSALDFADLWASNARLNDSESVTRAFHELMQSGERDLHLQALVRRAGDHIDVATFADPGWARAQLDDLRRLHHPSRPLKSVDAATLRLVLSMRDANHLRSRLIELARTEGAANDPQVFREVATLARQSEVGEWLSPDHWKTMERASWKSVDGTYPGGQAALDAVAGLAAEARRAPGRLEALLGAAPRLDDAQLDQAARLWRAVQFEGPDAYPALRSAFLEQLDTRMANIDPIGTGHDDLHYAMEGRARDLFANGSSTPSFEIARGEVAHAIGQLGDSLSSENVVRLAASPLRPARRLDQAMQWLVDGRHRHPVDPEIRRLAADTVKYLRRSIAVMEGTASSVGYSSYPDHAELGRAVQNAKLVVGLTDASSPSAPVGTATQRLTW